MLRLYLIGFIAILSIAGCASIEDVTNDPSYVGTYKTSQALIVQVPLFMDKPWGDMHYILPPRQSPCNVGLSGDDIPLSLNDYLANKNAKYSRFIGVLMPGTKVRFTKAEFMSGADQRLFIEGIVEDGEFKETKLALDYVSNFRFRMPSIRYGRQFDIRPECLKP